MAKSSVRQVLRRYGLSTFARRASSLAGASVWNSLSDYLRDSAVIKGTFKHHLKRFCLQVNDARGAVGNALKKFTSSMSVLRALCHSILLIAWKDGSPK